MDVSKVNGMVFGRRQTNESVWSNVCMSEVFALRTDSSFQIFVIRHDEIRLHICISQSINQMTSYEQ